MFDFLTNSLIKRTPLCKILVIQFLTFLSTAIACSEVMAWTRKGQQKLKRLSKY